MRFALRYKLDLHVVSHSNLNLNVHVLLLSYIFDIGTLIADLLLCHLEPARAEASCDHFLSAVAPPLSRSRLGHRPVVCQLDKVADVELLEGHPQVHHDVRSLGSLRVATVA